VIIGDGALRAQLEHLAESLGLKEDVIFAGSRRDVEEFYPALDIVALTSLNEGTPLTLIEAMANARPVISTSVGGVVDLLGKSVSPDSDSQFVVCERGLRVPVNDAAAFADGLGYLINDSIRRREIGECGLLFVESKHSKNRLLEDVSALYTGLIAGKAPCVAAQSRENRLESRI
jgi:glycosyltransferase involved in cell wall biosynthesis